MRKLFLVSGVLAMILIFAGFQWPVESKKLTATFGSNRFESFFPGIEISGDNGAVKAVSSGEVVYFEQGENDFPALPRGLGNFVVVQHDGGLQSIYAHLKEQSIDVDQRIVDQSSRVGEMGDTGYAYGKSLYFSLFDQELNRLINPLLILPSIDDDRPPLIKNAVVKMENKTVRLDSPEDLSVGRGELVATVYDQSSHVDYYSPMAPFAVTLFVNGEEKMSVEFEGLGEDEGRLVLLTEEKTAHSEFYKSEWNISFGLIDISPGTTMIEFIARDIYDNETSAAYTLTVSSE